jgi:tetratricopeptide (TPR) repeat protein
MAKKTKITEPTHAEKNVGEILSKTDQFVEKHLKEVLIGIATIIVLVVAVIGIRHAYFIPKEKEAQEAIFQGENLMESQQWDVALNGNSSDYIGFLNIIDDYSLTKTGNLAKAYSGICYYHLNDLESAIKYLKEYKGKDLITASAVTGLLGDCYVNLGEKETAVGYFLNAAEKAKSSTLSPIYLKKAAQVYESLEKYKEALNTYKAIKEKYPQSQEASTVDKYIIKVEALVN